jgi:hypothetical protein
MARGSGRNRVRVPRVTVHGKKLILEDLRGLGQAIAINGERLYKSRAGCNERDRKIADLQAKLIGANASGQSSKPAGSKTELQSAQPVLLAPAQDRRAPRMNANGR